MSAPIVLTIAGSDSSGGAGIQADLKTFSALGAYGCSVITALTAQNTVGVTGIMDVPADFITEQMAAVFDDLDVAAVKIGMLSRPETIEAVARGLKAYEPRHVVLDPVMVAKSGDTLLQADAVESLKENLLPLATVITPNLPEARVLLGRETLIGRGDMEAVAQDLRGLGPRAVLLKGGHLNESASPDVLFDGTVFTAFEADRVDTDNTHGTGCTLSSAIAALLARGLSLDGAVRAAKTYITDALRAADQLHVGQGHGPVHHFHAYWTHLEDGR